MLVGVSRLKLLNNILITLNCSLHLFLKVIELSFELGGLPLLKTDLVNLLVKIVFYEFHFEKDIACLIYSILAWVHVYFMTLVLKIDIFVLVDVASGVKVGIFWILRNSLTLILILYSINDFGVDKVALSWETSDRQVDEVSRFPR